MSTDSHLRRTVRAVLEDAGMRPTAETIQAGTTTITADAHPEAAVEKLRWRARTEHDALTAFADDVDADDTVWDVGAALGLHACVALQCGANAVAVEPQPGLLPVLAANLRHNQSATATADIAAVALADTAGTVALSHPADEPPATGTVSVQPYPEAGGYTGVHAAARRAADLIDDGLPAPDVLKIDVEGAEQLVVDGFGDRLGDVRVVYSEIHRVVEDDRRPCIEDYGSTPQRYLDTLADAGFDHDTVIERGDELHVRSTQR